MLHYLLGTGDRVLVKASPYDTIWRMNLGATHPDAVDPSNCRGQNLIGRTLQKVRGLLRETAHQLFCFSDTLPTFWTSRGDIFYQPVHTGATAYIPDYHARNGFCHKDSAGGRR